MNGKRHNLAWLSVALVWATAGCDEGELDTTMDGGTTDAGPDGAIDGGMRDAEAGTDPCISTCVDILRSCADGGKAPDFSEALSQATARCAADAGFSQLRSVREGRCGDGKTVLFESFGLGGVYTFYGDAGAFIGATYASDGIDVTCLGKRYWPMRVSCTGAMATRVHCGTPGPLGDPI